MIRVIFDDLSKIPIKSWADDIENNTLGQIYNLSNLPFAFKHIAILPDVHFGKGMPIGSVVVTKNVIVPNAVGSDIGCGMVAAKTSMNIKDTSIEEIKTITGAIRQQIPVGFKKHKQRQNWADFDDAPLIAIVESELNNAAYQLGTLGGGNHFIELQSDTNSYIWIMLHSGSRHIGYAIAKYYHTQAVILCEKWFSDLPTKDLSFLPLDSSEGNEYLDAMDFALKYALANRRRMLKRIEVIIRNVKNAKLHEPINVHHNFAAMENHFGQNVMVHRKGATRAYEGQLGIIPGSQGSHSYIVKGKGNPESFKSCSHGAGRIMSRTKAKSDLDLETEKKKLDDMGVIHSVRNVSDLDEAPGSYKDIETVMANQKDLVDIQVKLKPLAVIKG